MAGESGPVEVDEHAATAPEASVSVGAGAVTEGRAGADSSGTAMSVTTSSIGGGESAPATPSAAGKSLCTVAKIVPCLHRLDGRAPPNFVAVDCLSGHQLRHGEGGGDSADTTSETRPGHAFDDTPISPMKRPDAFKLAGSVDADPDAEEVLALTSHGEAVDATREAAEEGKTAAVGAAAGARSPPLPAQAAAAAAAELRRAESPPLPAQAAAMAAATSAPGAASPPLPAQAAGASTGSGIGIPGAEEAGPPPVDATVAEGPLAERLVSKQWKTRRDAYSELAELLSDAPNGADVFSEYSASIPKAAKESNANALAVALTAVTAFTDLGPSGAVSDVAAATCAALVSNGFNAKKLATRDAAVACVLLFIEVGNTEAGVEALLDGLRSRKPAVPPTCVSALRQAVECFGIPDVPPKALLAALPGLLNSTKHAVRSAAKDLAVELYRWMRDHVMTKLSSLRPVMLKDLEAAFAATGGADAPAPVPTRYTRAHRPKNYAAHGSLSPSQSKTSPSPRSRRSRRSRGNRKSGGSAGSPGGADVAAGGAGGAAAHGSGGPAAPAMDPWDLADSVDLTAALSRIKLDAGMASAKWKDRAGVFDEVLKAIGPTPKITPGEFSTLVAHCKAALKDSNMQVNAKAIQVIGALGAGLRHGFSHTARRFVRDLLLRFKEKHPVMRAAVIEALDRLHGWCFSLEDILSEITLALKHANKDVRTRTAEFVGRCALSKKPGAPSPSVSGDVAKQLWDVLLVGAGDREPTVRDACGGALGALVSATGGTDATLSGKLAALSRDSGMKATLARVTASVSGSSSTSGEQGQLAARAAGPTASAGTSATRSSATRGKTSARPSRSSSRTRAGASASNSSGAARKPSKSRPARSAADDDEDNAGDVELPSESDAIETVGGLEGVDVDALSAKKWQDRVAAITALSEACTSDSSVQQGVLDAAVVVLRAKTKGFKESNFNILKAVFGCMSNIYAAATPPFTRTAAAALVPPAALKLRDRKLAVSSGELLTGVAEAVGPRLVVRVGLKALAGAKAGLGHSEFAGWVESAVSEFGASAFDLTALAQWCCGPTGLGGNAQQKKAVTALLSTLYSQLGPVVRQSVLTCDGAPTGTELDRLDDAFKKSGYKPGVAPQSKRAIKSSDGAAAGSGGAGGPPTLEASRTDIGGVLSTDVLRNMKETGAKDAWKRRSAALDAVERALSANPYIEPNSSCRSLVAALRLRLLDTNPNLKAKAVDLIGALAQCVGPKGSTSYAKAVAKALLACSGDRKKSLREAVVRAADRWVMHDGELVVPALDQFFVALPAALGADGAAKANSDGRTDLLKWAHTHVTSLQPNTSHGQALASLAPALVVCLQDPSREVRAAAEKMLAEVVRCAGKDCVNTVIRDLKPAAIRALAPVLERLFSEAAASEKTGAASGTSGAPRDSSRGGETGTAAAADAAETSSDDEEPAPALFAPKPSSTTRPRTAAASRRRGRTSRPASAPSQGSRAAAVSTDGDASGEVPLQTTDAREKDKRARRNARNKWEFDTPRREFVEELQGMLAHHASPTLVENMFSRVRTKVDAAFHTISDTVIRSPDSVLCNLDLVLKWCTLRMYDNNVQGTNKLIACLRVLFEMLEGSDYRLSDYEAGVFLPHLVGNIGHAKERFRQGYRAVMRAVVRVYPASKFTPYLLEGLKSKNTRVCHECLAELELIVRETGWSVLGRKGVNQVAGLVDREAEMRKSALDILEVAWVQHGSDTTALFKLLGSSISERARSLMQERFKFHKGDAPELPHAPQGSPGSVPRGSPDYASAGRGGAGGVAVDEFGTPLPKTVSSPSRLIDAAMDASNYGASPLSPSTDANAGVFEFHVDFTGIDGTPAVTAAGARSRKSTRKPMAASRGGSGGSGGALPRHDRTGSPAVSTPEGLGPPLPLSRELSLSQSLASDTSAGADDGTVPESITRLMKGLQALVKLFKDYMSGKTRALDRSSKSYTAGVSAIEELTQACTDEDKDRIDMFVSFASQLVHTLTACMHGAFGKMYSEASPSAPVFEGRDADMSFLRKICACFMRLFQVEEFAVAIDARAMCAFVTELTQRLMDPRLADPTHKDRSLHEEIITAINKITIMASRTTTRETTFCALLRLLRRGLQSSSAERRATSPLPDKVIRLAVKLLMRVLKFETDAGSAYRQGGAATAWEAVNCAPILSELHRLFVAAEDAGSAQTDMPRLAATKLIEELVTARGPDLFHLVRDTEVMPTESPVASTYLEFMQQHHPRELAKLLADEKAGVLPAKAAVAAVPAMQHATPPQPPARSAEKMQSPAAVTPVAGSARSSGAKGSARSRKGGAASSAKRSARRSSGGRVSTAAVSTPPPPAPRAPAAVAAVDEAEVRARLTEIFARLGDPHGHMKEAIADLWRFKQEHPEMDFEPQLKSTSSSFQKFIRSQLAMLEKQAAGQADSAKARSANPTKESAAGEQQFKQRLAKLQERFQQTTAATSAPAPAAGESRAQRSAPAGKDGSQVSPDAAAKRRSGASPSKSRRRTSTELRRSPPSGGPRAGRRPAAAAKPSGHLELSTAKGSPPGGAEGEALTDSTSAANSDSSPSSGGKKTTTSKRALPAKAAGSTAGATAPAMSLDEIRARLAKASATAGAAPAARTSAAATSAPAAASSNASALDSIRARMRTLK